MRTITDTFKKRLIAQSNEAKLLGMTKLASTLEEQANTNPTRTDETEYVYAQEDLKEDIKKQLWAAAVRIQDYYGKLVDGRDVANIVETLADELHDSLRVKAGVISGPYEPAVAGEVKEVTSIEVSSED